MTSFDTDDGRQRPADTAPPPPAPMRRACFVVAYDGEPFHGFARNRGVRTVMGDLIAAIERVVRHPVELAGAGRTDTGVHAWGQVVSGDLPANCDLDDLARRLNRLLAPSVAVRDPQWSDDPEFSARFSALWRHYRYHVLNAEVPNPLVAARAWHIAQPLSLWAMRAACDALIGEHDFSAFCRMPKHPAGQPPPNMRRRVLLADWREVVDDERPGLLRFEIRATAFCHQMVRSIVGTMVRVGRGELRPGDLLGILRAKDRALASQIAPPHGLCLWEVGYPTSHS